MAQEFTQSFFFDQSTYSDTYNAAKIPLEYFLAETLLRGDLSRIAWTSTDMAFRRRMELNDTENGVNFTSEYKPTSLGFPFLSYWYTPGEFWEPDDRPASQSAAMMTRGLWEQGLPTYMRAMAVKTTFEATAYYDSDQDARVAYNKLLWETNPKGPIQFASSVSWRNVEVAVPSFFTIETPSFNPEYKEGDWLKKQRIFPVAMKITLRTYAIHYPHQLSLKTGKYPEIATYGTGIATDVDHQLSITERVLLAFAEEKAWIDSATTGNADPITDLSGAPETLADALIPSQPITDSSGNVLLGDIAQAYFEATRDITINEVLIDPASITPTSFTINWVIRQADISFVSKITIAVPGRDPIVITDMATTSYTVTDLYNYSDYGVVIMFYSANGSIKDVHLSVKTLPEPGNAQVTKPRRRRLGLLKGQTLGDGPV